ncbi:MAG: transporter substrate-binding domain-containing protein, partial [Actinomycetales bacterium]|nr:transporter substrate-binding domain-containing protein [Actinomycetales bacterium]
MQNRRSFIRKSGLVLSAAALGGLAACSQTSSGGGGGEVGEDGGGDLLSRLQEAGTITVGFAGEAPYSFDEDGELTGATVAMHREIFGELGIDNVEGKLTDWGSLIPGLNSGQFDAVSAGMSILPDRCAEAAFSEPEFQYT